MRKICNNPFEPRNKFFDQLLKKKSNKLEPPVAWGNETTYTDFGTSAWMATTNAMIMASGGLKDDGDIIDGPGNSIVGNTGVKQANSIQVSPQLMNDSSYTVTMQALDAQGNPIGQPIVNNVQGMATGGFVGNSFQYGYPTFNTIPLTTGIYNISTQTEPAVPMTDAELIQNLMARVRELEDTIDTIMLTCRVLNEDIKQYSGYIAGLAAKKVPEVAIPEPEPEEQPKRKFRPLQLEA